MNPTDWLYVPQVQQAVDYLHTVHRNLVPPELQPFTRHVMGLPGFLQAPASRTNHHNFPGGLVIHTADVIKRCVSLSPSMLNMDVVIVAAFYHDCCKVFEYDYTFDVTDPSKNIITATPYRDEIGHIFGAAMMFKERCNELGTDSKFRDTVLHCILSHHGRKEWGSPVEPRIPEAWLLHSCDMMSSQDRSQL